MRQALFAVVLVAASFAGGAVVNGPGLRWAQVWAMGRLGLVQEADGAGPVAGPHADDEGTIPPLDVQPAAADRSVAASASAGPDTPRPDATTGPLAPEPTVGRSAATPDPLEPLAPLPPPLNDRSAVAASASISTAPLAPVAPTPLPDPESPPAVPAAAAASTSTDGAAPPPARGRGDASVALASLARPARPESTEPPAPNAAGGASAPVPADPADWPEVRRALRDLGVSRYGTDGAPGGRVRFHCVIPLAGRHAVGQQFEAEADDELQAARAALRRIALWRASDGGSP